MSAFGVERTWPALQITSGFDPELTISGLVGSLSRPGANLTGVSLIGVEMAVKGLELMRELLPQAAAVAMIINPDYPESHSRTCAPRRIASFRRRNSPRSDNSPQGLLTRSRTRSIS